MTQLRKTTFHLIAVLAPGLFPAMAWAITAPAAGDLGYDAYDLVVNQMLNGPVGFVGGVASIVAGASQLMKSWMLALLGIWLPVMLRPV